MSALNTYSTNYQLKDKKRVEKLKNDVILSKLISVLIFISISTLLFTFFYSLITFSENDKSFINHEIKKGESLWSIANKYYKAEDIDIRKVIYEIKNLNEIKSAIIRPGEKIIIPLN